MNNIEKEILESIKMGKESKVLEYLYKEILPGIKQYILKNSGTIDDAFDIFQDGVVIFYKYVLAGKFKEEYNISGFIYTVCRNLWINKVKHEKLITKIDNNREISDHSKDVLDYLINKEREDLVKQYMEKLGEKCRKLLSYIFYYQLTTKELCEKMGYSNTDILKTKKYKCKKRLIELMKNHKN